MNTAIELADEFPEQNLANIEPDAANLLNGWGLEAVAMLLQQAEQIEALTKQVFALTGEVANKADYAKSMYLMHQEAQAQCEALKADAERYQWWVTQVELKDFENLEKAFKSMEVREDVTKQMMDAAIDAMRGKS